MPLRDQIKDLLELLCDFVINTAGGHTGLIAATAQLSLVGECSSRDARFGSTRTPTGIDIPLLLLFISPMIVQRPTVSRIINVVSAISSMDVMKHRG